MLLTTNSIYVQVEGLNLAKPLNTEHQQLLHELWREHLLLIFRAGYLDPGSQERVLRESSTPLITDACSPDIALPLFVLVLY